MGTVFRKAWTAPVPPGAEIVEQRGKRIARYRIRSGKLRTAEVFTAADGRVRIRGETKAYIAKFRDAAGLWIERPTGCTDETAARAVLAQLERRTELVRAGVLTPEEDAASKHGAESIDTNLDAWRDHLRLKGSTEHWYTQARRRVARVTTDRGVKRLRDFTAAAVERWLADQADTGMSAGTRNGYRQACVTFVNWCVRAGRLTHNPLLAVAVADQRADIRRQRRALTEEELARLLDAAQRRPLADAMTVRRGEDKGKRLANLSPKTREQLMLLGRERALVYKTLVLTGLRKGELASITVGQVDLAGRVPHLLLHARDEKNRRGSEIPLRTDLAADIRSWLADRLARAQRVARDMDQPIPATLPTNEPLFDVPDGLIRIFDRDLVFAGLARIEKRGGKEVVVKTDDRGRTIDVHALRHTFGTHLSKAGVPLRTAQAAMRHSDPSLTANVYTDPKLLDVAGAVASLPDLPLGQVARPATAMAAR
ncbi:MAG: tyrosine-type recombinase/integrase [Planctomycetes bacterium]|nr:tyrosine-type recombinase/integrase [Planctomycetota bacterium]